MKEIFNTDSVVLHEEYSLGLLIKEYNRLLSEVKVRTYHILSDWQHSFPNYEQFFIHFFKTSPHEITKIHNCGRITVEEILGLREKIRGFWDEIPLKADRLDMSDQPVTKKIVLPSNIDSILPLFMTTITGMSSRSANRVHWLLQDCNYSLSSFYERISDSNCIKSIPTVGRKSIPELQDFFERSIFFFYQFPNEESVSSRLRHYLITSSTALNLPEEAVETLSEKEHSLGYFPIFAALQLYFQSLPDEEKALVEGCLLIHQNQELPEREDVAATLNLSSERIRQKRNILISSLPEYFKKYYNYKFITKNPYRYQMNHVEDEVNAAEGTDFNQNFVSWVLGSVFDDITIVGDPIRSLGGYFETDQYISLVPTTLTHLFDFAGFILDLNERMAEKRMGEEKIKLKDLINAHLTAQYCEDELPEVETTCRTILYLHFPVDVDLGYVILPPNAYKTNQFIIESLLRKAGRPMTFDEIYEEYKYQYPERDSTESSLRGAIRSNKNIVPVGRSSTYALTEWSHNEYRGGTIRSFVQEYIDSIPEGIATTAAITEYVLRFRPDTNEQSIVSNISLDPSKTFVLYYKDGERLFGYSNREFPLEYFPVESDFRFAITNSIYYPKFIRFIETNHRFPFSSGYTEEESFLRRFWMKQESRYKNGKLDSHAIQYYEKIERAYGHLKMEKTEYEWRVQYVHAAHKYHFPIGVDVNLLNIKPAEDIDTWLIRNYKDYYFRQKYMPEWRIEYFTPFANYLKEHLANSEVDNEINEFNVQDNLG